MPGTLRWAPDADPDGSEGSLRTSAIFFAKAPGTDTLPSVEVGDRIAGRYRLLRRIASGGMGEVWAARNELTNRDFAIKFLLAEFAQNHEAFTRFVREAETTGTLRHPSIVDVFDVAQAAEGRPFIVMELLHGEGLDVRLSRDGPLSQFETAAYFAQLAMALDQAHRAGVIHRDLSASNVYLAQSRDDDTIVPKILDFGVSKNLACSGGGEFQTVHGAVLGNPVYMSPEQARGAEQVDARTDVWALGVLMYQCLTGRPPFESRNYNALMVQIMTQPHSPLSEAGAELDPQLCEIVEGCLQKDREKRLPLASDLADQLGHVTRRLARELGSTPPSPRRRATDRIPVEGPGVGGPTPDRDTLVPQGMSYLRVASLAAFAGLAMGAFLVYALLGFSASGGSPGVTRGALESSLPRSSP